MGRNVCTFPFLVYDSQPAAFAIIITSSRPLTDV